MNPLLHASPNKLVLKNLLNLPTLLPDVLSDVEELEIEELRRAQLNESNLPPVLVGGNDDDGREVDCASCWLMVKLK